MAGGWGLVALSVAASCSWLLLPGAAGQWSINTSRERFACLLRLLLAATHHPSCTLTASTAFPAAALLLIFLLLQCLPSSLGGCGTALGSTSWGQTRSSSAWRRVSEFESQLHPQDIADATAALRTLCLEDVSAQHHHGIFP